MTKNIMQVFIMDMIEEMNCVDYLKAVKEVYNFKSAVDKGGCVFTEEQQQNVNHYFDLLIDKVSTGVKK